MCKRLICFSLFHSNRKRFDLYLEGALRNIDLAHRFYPDFQCRFYIAEIAHLQDRLQRQGAEVVVKPTSDVVGLRPVLWRYEPLASGDFDVCLFRDADSLIGLREAVLVQQFLDGGKSFHVIRDHPNHVRRIMAGMWGARTTTGQIARVIQSAYGVTPDYGFEELHFESLLWPLIAHDVLEHDSSQDPSCFVEDCAVAYVGQVFRN